jgi:hypothetical protein
MPGLSQVLYHNGVKCPTSQRFENVDGYSVQSAALQHAGSVAVCLSEPQSYWLESLDGGIHLSKIGAFHFADALDAAVKERGIKLPG